MHTLLEEMLRSSTIERLVRMKISKILSFVMCAACYVSSDYSFNFSPRAFIVIVISLGVL